LKPVVLAALTVMVKLGSAAAVLVPLLTLMMMLLDAPTLEAAGVPLSWPVELLNVAQLGGF
jgi:hypothetical protein